MPDRESKYFDLSLESLRAIGGWAADWAERALRVYESRASSDSRPRAAIELAPPEARDVLLKMPAREGGRSRLDAMLYQLDAGIRTRTEDPARDVRIRPYDDADLPLLRALLGDAGLTHFIGGPETEDALVARHARYLAADPVTNGLFTVFVEADPVGWVGFWESEWEESVQWECGWHVLAAHQGKGVASAAARLLLDKARSRDRHRFIDAFPSAANVASNALCRHLGFLDLGEVAVEYPRGTMMRARHWRYDLTGGVT